MGGLVIINHNLVLKLERIRCPLRPQIKIKSIKKRSIVLEKLKVLK